MNYAPRREKQILNDPGLVIVPPGPGERAFWFSVVLAVLTVAGFLWGAAKVKEAGLLPNDFLTTGGNVAHGELRSMSYALHARKYQEGDPEGGVTESFLRWLPHATDGEMQPLWPWVASRLVEPEHAAAGFDVAQDRRLLERGRRTQLWLGGGFLLLCGLLAARALSPAAALAAVLPGAFAALLPYGLLFRPDLLHWVLIFLSWVCALRLLRRNSVWLHGVFGVLSGLAWLTDATALIVPAAWLVAATAQWVRTSLRRGEQAVDESWIARNHFVGLVALALGWVMVCGPRCGAAMERWGRPLFTWQQCWMWCDSAEEARQYTLRYNDAQDVAGRRVPLQGWDEYWRTHTPEQARERLATGWHGVWRNFLALDTRPGEGGDPLTRLSTRRGLWLGGAGVLLLVAGGVVLCQRRAKDAGAAPRYGTAAGALFVACAAAGYGLWFAWYTPIESDDRLLMVLYLPLMWSLVWGAEKLMTLALMRGASRRAWLAWQVLAWVFCAAVAVDAILLLSGTDLAVFAGAT